MTADTKERLLKISLVTFGVIFFLIYPLGYFWPSGWVWHGGDGYYYLHMIIGVYAVLGGYLIYAARDPQSHRGLIGFTIWSSVVHATVMAYYSFQDAGETGHLMADIPALYLVAGVLGYLSSGPAAEKTVEQTA